MYAYWVLVVLMTATMLHSLSYTFLESLMLGTLLLPGGIIIKFELPTILKQPVRQKTSGLILLSLTVIVIGFLLMFAGHAILIGIRHDFSLYDCPRQTEYIPKLLLNPVFLIILMFAFSGGDYFLANFLREHLKESPSSITFTSDRKPVTMLHSEILYVESNDTEVWIHSTDGQKYRNKTPISQWENLLGIDFLRIHRSYLVACAHILKTEADTLTLDNGQILPISRKYRDLFRPE